MHHDRMPVTADRLAGHVLAAIGVAAAARAFAAHEGSDYFFVRLRSDIAT